MKHPHHYKISIALAISLGFSGSTHIVISKVDIFTQLNLYKLIYNNLIEFNNIIELKEFINKTIYKNCNLVKDIIYSDNYESIDL